MFRPQSHSEHQPQRFRARQQPTAVIFIPGFLSSRLYRGKKQYWPHVGRVLLDLSLSQRPRDHPPELFGGPLEVKGIVSAGLFTRLFKREVYDRWLDFFIEHLGYQQGDNLLVFAYDWRQDLRLVAQQLAEQVRSWTHDRLIVIGHSMGGLVARYYVECLGGKERVDQLILMGTPHLGIPRAFVDMTFGPRLPLARLRTQVRDASRTWPAAYQVLPRYDCIVDDCDQPFDPFTQKEWLPKHLHGLLEMAVAFHAELPECSSVPTISIVGHSYSTICKVTFDGTNVSWAMGDGDGTLPPRSSTLAGTRILTVQQNHGALGLHGDVQQYLRDEFMQR